MSATGPGGSVWSAPKHVSQQQVADAHKYALDVLAARPAATRQFVADRCSALLLHFFVGASGEKLNAMVAADWLALLAPFPADVLQAATMRWLETSTGKPKPHEIRDLCITFYGRTNWENFEHARLISQMTPSEGPAPKAPGEPEEYQKPTDAQKANVARMMHENFHKAVKAAGCPFCQTQEEAKP